MPTASSHASSRGFIYSSQVKSENTDLADEIKTLESAALEGQGAAVRPRYETENHEKLEALADKILSSPDLPRAVEVTRLVAQASRTPIEGRSSGPQLVLSGSGLTPQQASELQSKLELVEGVRSARVVINSGKFQATVDLTPSASEEQTQ